jgi:hypothetical protein
MIIYGVDPGAPGVPPKSLILNEDGSPRAA